MTDEFEWDEDKRASALQKHGLDFVDAARLWRGPVWDPAAARVVEGEERFTAIGALPAADRAGLSVIAVICTCVENAAASSAFAPPADASGRITVHSSNDPPLPSRTDWNRVLAMTDDEINATRSRIRTPRC